MPRGAAYRYIHTTLCVVMDNTIVSIAAAAWRGALKAKAKENGKPGN